MEWVKKLGNISKFKSYETIFTFNKTFSESSFFNLINSSLLEINPDELFNYYHQIDEAIHQLDQLILSLAPFSYKDEAFELQNKFNKLRSYLEKIPNGKTSFERFIDIIRKNQDRDFDSIQTLLSKDFKIIDKDNKKFFLNLKKDKEIKKDTTENSEIKASLQKEPIKSKIDKKVSEEISEKKLYSNSVDLSDNFERELSSFEESKGPSLREEFQDRIDKRNMLLQALLDIYHDKKMGYKLMLTIFRGLDVYRRMSLSGDRFNKDLFMNNIKKSLVLYEDANLIKLSIQKCPKLTYNDVKKMIIDCLKIINKQIDKSRFKLYFDDKLNYRSGFNQEFQQKVEWLYLPQKRRPKRNIDELYTIKSVTDNANKFSQTSRSYSSLLSSRDIDICNKILFKVYDVYYQDGNIRKFLIKLFYSLDNFDYSKHEYSDKQKNDFKVNFQNITLDESKNCGLVKIIINLNPKINPVDIKTLMPITLKIMKEKIDIGFERKKKVDPTLQNSFNPMEKYYRIYDKKLFRIYKRV